MPKPLHYIFAVSFQSCADPNQWIERYSYKTRNTGNPYAEAAEIATKSLAPTESGVRVHFLGLQAESEAFISSLNPFTLTLLRGEYAPTPSTRGAATCIKRALNHIAEFYATNPDMAGELCGTEAELQAALRYLPQ